MYGSKVEGIRMNLSGRLLRYKPETGEVDILITDMAFANGVAVDNDEKYVLCVSTFDRAVFKYHLNGENAGQVERLLDQFPGKFLSF
jgi:sugar lactone lactonase YvrE